MTFGISYLYLQGIVIFYVTAFLVKSSIQKVCALAMNPIMVMNWRLLMSMTLKESSMEKNTLTVWLWWWWPLIMAMIPSVVINPLVAMQPFGGYERVWYGYERGYERIWNPWWLWLTINTPKESANGESTWGDVETMLNWSSSNSLYVRCIAMGDWVRGSARGLPVVRSQWD